MRFLNADVDLRLLILILVILTVFVIVLTGIATFVKALEISGVISGGLTGVLIVLMTLKAKKLGNRKPEYVVPINWFIALFLIAVFVSGAGYYLWSIL